MGHGMCRRRDPLPAHRPLREAVKLLRILRVSSFAMRPHHFFAVFFVVLGSAFAYDPLEPYGPIRTDYFEFVKGKRTVPLKVYYPEATPAEPAPVIFFSHGLGGSMEGSSYLGEHWAGRGYTAVFLQHPGSDESIWKGKTPAQARKAMKKAANARQHLLRTRDVNIAIAGLTAENADPSSPLFGRMDLSRIGMSGHSFGAKTTQAVSGEVTGTKRKPTPLRIPQVVAAIPMSPSPANRKSPEVSFGQVDIPWLCMTGTLDGSPGGITDTTPEERREVFAALPPLGGQMHELVLYGAEHSAFTERGDNKNPNHHRAILALSTAFWDAHLKSDTAAAAWLQSSPRSVLEDPDVWLSK